MMGFLEPKFFKQTLKEVPPYGKKDAPIAIVGEAPGRVEGIKGVPFSGPAGNILTDCINGVGLLRQECYITNVFKVVIDKQKMEGRELWSKLWNDEKGFLPGALPYLENLWREIQDLDCKVIVTMGKVAFSALYEFGSYFEWRGYPMMAKRPEGRLMIPTIHPAETLWARDGSGAISMFLIKRDLMKAKLISEGYLDRMIEIEPEIPQSIDYALELLLDMSQESPLSVDIETYNGEVTCIGLSTTVSKPVTIVFDSELWSEQEELILWDIIAVLLGDRKVTKIMQGGIFDKVFMWQQYNILIDGPIEDTMLAHSVIYPELPKGLNFLGSFYTMRPRWKNMVRFKKKDIVKKEGY